MTVTAPRGFRATGVVAGIKESGGRDLALVINDGPSCAAAGVFTANRVKAAPVLWTQQVVAGGRVRAVVLNSGGANACTGPAGFADTHQTAEHLAKVISQVPVTGAGGDPAAGDLAASGTAAGDTEAREAGAGETGAGEIAVCSTGLIGERLPLDRLLGGIDMAVAACAGGADGGLSAADAIRTTDTVAKTCSAGGTGYLIGGMAKGAAMLSPALATMLAVLTTDADLSAAELDTALRAAVRPTFDRLDTDGCMSTNDTVLLMASGASGVTPDQAEFVQVLTEVCADLARQLQLDAEGANKMIAIEVVGAASEADAVTAGRAVARNNLLKCAIGGEDPNWGRVLSAVGTTDAVFEPDRLNVAINGIWVCRHGAPGDERSKVDLKPKDVTITVDLSAGPHSAIILTTDLTTEYVHENSAYST
ncbi:MAG TPA: bifunctional ornithine acetyltransferase/N-acetylglutamate synthase [Streptosporangiaceae bacterium]